jgi:hypothetical protein
MAHMLEASPTFHLHRLASGHNQSREETMARGLYMPVGVNPSGGAALIDGDDNDAKIIKMALSSDNNENAFQQDIGLGESMVFDLNDQALRAKIRRRLLKIFENFERQKRYKLKKDTIKWEENTVDQELALTFKYVNLESDEEKPFRRVFSAQE